MSLFVQVSRSFRLMGLAFCMGVASVGAIAQSTAVINTVYSLNANTDGRGPYAPVVQGPDGDFYGTTSQGGVDGYGSIYKVSSMGTFTLLYSFQGNSAGQGTLSGLTYASDGNFYGTATGGDNGSGMVFKISPSGTFVELYSFTGGTDGGTPESGVIEASDGNFYGTTAAGGNSFSQVGTIYKLSPDGILTTIYTFTGLPADGGQPFAGLVEGSDGSFYGTTNQDETFFGVGTVFKVTPAGAFTTLYSFQGGNDGGNPDGGLVEGADGNFYGSTHNYGLFANDDDDTGQGVLYKVTPTGTFTTLYEFTGNADSGRPEGTMALGSDGNFYGTTTNSPMGTLFQLTPAGLLTTLGPLGQNAEALSGPILGSDGDVYGTTNNGGTTNSGDIFQAVLSPALLPPVQLSLSAANVALGGSVTLSWTDVNAYSNTMQRCIASVQGGLAGAGAWSGVQTGTATGGSYAGMATIAPTASGTYVYALTCGGTVSGFATLTVPAMTLPTSSLPDGTVGIAYSATLAEANGLAPFTWKLVSGSLPGGLDLNASTGAISGTPSASGDSSFTVQVTDSESTPATVSSTVTLTIGTVAPTVTLSAASLSIATAGSSASTVLVVSGFASDAFSFSCLGLPAKAACVFGAVNGSQAYATVALQIITDGSLQAQSSSSSHGSYPLSALAFPGLLALLGACGARRKFGAVRLLGLVGVLLLAGAAFNGCSSGNKASYGTPAGTSTITVTAKAGDQSATTKLTLTVQ